MSPIQTGTKGKSALTATRFRPGPMASCSYDDFDEEDIDDDILQDCGLPTAAERAAAIAAATAAASAPSADAATWNVVEFSADPVLLDEDRRTLFAGVEAQWHAYRNRLMETH